MGCSDAVYSSSNSYNSSINDSVGVYVSLYNYYYYMPGTILSTFYILTAYVLQSYSNTFFLMRFGLWGWQRPFKLGCF